MEREGNHGQKDCFKKECRIQAKRRVSCKRGNEKNWRIKLNKRVWLIFLRWENF